MRTVVACMFMLAGCSGGVANPPTNGDLDGQEPVYTGSESPNPPPAPATTATSKDKDTTSSGSATTTPPPTTTSTPVASDAGSKS